MPDLVEKYFREDLSEEEQIELSQSLLDSEDAAFKFSRLAREAYLRSGLPEPEPRWKDEPPPSRPSSWTGMILLAAGLGLSALFLTHFWARFHFPAPMVLSRAEDSSAVETSAPSAADENSGSSQAGSSQGAAPAAAPPPVKADFGIPKTPPSSADADIPAPEDQTAPVNLDVHPRTTFPDLSVVVDQAQTGPLKVSVLDPQGSEALVLYQGTLTPGHWIFEWNGKLSGGKPPAGTYEIQVQSGLFSQQKPVQIQ
jgi:hypothetical protein